MKSILLIGLGRFGRHIAQELNELGHQVMAIDSNEDRVNAVLSYVTNAQIGDSTSEYFLRSLGVGNFDVCIVTIGGNFQSSLETTSLLKELDSQLTSIPGIGTVLAATILSEIGDISRFSSTDKLLTYAGLDPSVKQSGEFRSNQNRMSKRGSPYLRRAIWLASTVAVQCDPMFQTYSSSCSYTSPPSAAGLPPHALWSAAGSSGSGRM